MTTAPPLPQSFPDLTPASGTQTGAEVSKLVGLMQRLLAPDGCPWDREQTLETLVPYLIEETYEVVDALAEGTVDDHQEELGDLLLQIVFQSAVREAQGAFGIDDVARGIVTKLVRRHPHVFGDVIAKDTADVLANWAKLKAAEKASKPAKTDSPRSALDGVPRSAPALLAASRTGEKASAVGFDWPDATGPRAKVDEELAEFDRACASGNRDEMAAELGDILLAVVNLARKLGIDAEGSLRGANDRFGRRFRHVESSAAAAGQSLQGMTMEQQDTSWRVAKIATSRNQQSEP